jgi:SNF2 family DNA or RNA helicase
MKYSSDENFIYLSGFYTTKEKMEPISGHYTKKGWRFPKNLHVYRELYKFFPALQQLKEFIKDGQKAASMVEGIKLLKSNPLKIEGLRPYQSQDVGFLTSGSSLVLNEPRTGKTPTMIFTIKALKPKSVIVVSPSSLTYNWKKEIEKFTDMFDIHVYSGDKKAREKVWKEYRKSNAPHKVLIVSKDTLKRDSEISDMVYSVAIIDEAHFLRNYKTAQSKAIFNLTAKVKYALTGTPAVKHAVDVYGMLHFINPKKFPSYWQFAERYFHIDEDMWGKRIGNVKSYRKAELTSLMEEMSVQRKRTDVMKWLPAAQHQNLFVKMDAKQLKLYDQMLDTFMATMDDVEVDTPNVLTQLMRLRQLCLEPRLLGFDKVTGAKTTALLEYAENTQEPFIVMTTFSSYFKLIKPELEKLGKRVGIIDGKVNQKQKFATAEAFQSGEYDILLCNIIAAGTGFTLDRADTMVFLDKDFNPANNEQAQDRIVPTSEDRYHSINIITLVVAGSIDERVNDILERKEDLTQIINRKGLLV